MKTAANDLKSYDWDIAREKARIYRLVQASSKAWESVTEGVSTLVGIKINEVKRLGWRKGVLTDE